MLIKHGAETVDLYIFQMHNYMHFKGGKVTQWRGRRIAIIKLANFDTLDKFHHIIETNWTI
jgi:hypothetical protein